MNDKNRSSENDISSLEDYNDIILTNNVDCIKPIMTFDDFGLNQVLLLNIKNAQFENPSPVQSLAIPKCLLEQDILCQAKSGTGKTAVFVLSTIEIIIRYPEKYIVVLCNTIEMVYQIQSEYKRFSTNINIQNKILIIDINYSLQSLQQKDNTILIVDECDQIIFNKNFSQLYNKINPIVTMMFTATLIEKSKKECMRYLKNPFTIFVDDDTHLTLYGLKQYYLSVKTEKEKVKVIIELLQNISSKKTIIFCNKTQNAKYLHYILNINSYYLTQYESFKERIKILNAFKNQKNNSVLCTTDILSRGIDINDVTFVINYDLPDNPQTYLHRVGRAGRFETEGIAINLVKGIEDNIRLNEIMTKYEINITQYN